MANPHITLLHVSLLVLVSDAIQSVRRGALSEVDGAHLSWEWASGANMSVATSAKPSWHASEYGSGESCHVVCAQQGRACAVPYLPNVKSVKDAAKASGFNCDGVRTGSITSEYLEGPYIDLADNVTTEGRCYRPMGSVSSNCSLAAPSGTRRLCYCQEGATTTPAPHEPIWQDSWLWPAGRDFPEEKKLEDCFCYAMKDEHGAGALPVDVAHAHWHTRDDDGYGGQCDTYCKNHDDGPFHAADLHMLTDWSQRRPAVIVAHGQDGDKDDKWTVLMATLFRDAGFIVMSVQYKWATCQEDIGNAVQYLKANADSLGIHAGAIGIYGYSLGAKCGLQAGMKNAGIVEQNTQGVIDMSGCGGTGPFKQIRELVGDEHAPPALLVVHGDDDPIIEKEECDEMVQFARKKKWTNSKGKKQKLVIIEKYLFKGGHNLLDDVRTYAETIDAVFDFLFQYVGRPCRGDGLGFMGNSLIDQAWPRCNDAAEPLKQCGGTYEDAALLGPTCQYP